MSKWLTLVEIDLGDSPLVTKRYSSRAVSAPDYFYLPYLAGFGDFTRGVPKQPGLPTVSQFEVVFKNHTREFSKALKQYQFRGAVVRVRLGVAGQPIDDFATHFTGKIIGPPKLESGGRFARFQVKDSSGDIWKEEIPNDISVVDFPNLPPLSPAARANIILGYCTSEGKTDQGAVVCPYVDTVDHLYCLARHSTADLVNLYVLGAAPDLDFEIVEYIGPSGRHYDLIHFFEDIEDPAKTPTEFAVTADVKGLFFEGSPSDEHLIENPAELFRRVNGEFIGYGDDSFHEPSYSETYGEYDLKGYKGAGVIDWQGPKETIVDFFAKSFGLETFFNTAGLIQMGRQKVVNDEGTEWILDDLRHIQRGSFELIQNDEVINEIAPHFDFDPVNKKYLKEPPALENFLSQDAVGVTVKEDLEMRFIAGGPDTSPSGPSPAMTMALEVAGARMYWSDEGRWIAYFLLKAPKVPGPIDLTYSIKITHRMGLSLTKAGYVGELFKILELRYFDMAKTPSIGILAISAEPGPTAYLYEAEPANVVFDHSDETARGVINAYWNMPGDSPSAGPDPYWLHVWFKRVEDAADSIHMHYAGVVLAAAGSFSFEAIFPSAGDLNLIFVPETIDGVRRRHFADCTTAVHTNRTKIPAVASLAGQVARGEVDLSWDALTDPDSIALFRNYEIWRATIPDFSNEVLISDFVIGNHYEDTRALGATDYYYRIKSRTRYGVVSLASNGAGWFVLPDTGPPGLIALMNFFANGPLFIGEWLGAFDNAYGLWNVTGCTGDGVSPIVLTLDDDTRNLVSGMVAFVTGVGGNGAANGQRYFDVTGPHTVELRGSIGDGDFTAGGTLQIVIPPSRIEYFEEAYSPAEWNLGHSADANDAIRVNVGPVYTANGEDEKKTYWFALRLKVLGIDEIGPWTYKADSVTSGLRYKYIDARRKSYIAGDVDDPANAISVDVDTNKLEGPWEVAPTYGDMDGYFEFQFIAAGEQDLGVGELANVEIQGDAHYDGKGLRYGYDWTWENPSPASPSGGTVIHILFPAEVGSWFWIRFAKVRVL